MIQEALLKEKKMLAKEFYAKFKGLFGKQGQDKRGNQKK